MENLRNIHIGCGLFAPDSWVNIDASPTLRLQKLPLIGRLIMNWSGIAFPSNVIYGDIVERISKIKPGIVKAVYSSHMLEHLSLIDLRTSLENVYTMLGAGGCFRMVLPDLCLSAKKYTTAFEKDKMDASIDFMRETLLGSESRNRGLMAVVRSSSGNSKHQWMRDQNSLKLELTRVGFSSVRRCYFGDASDAAFKNVESEGRFIDAFALEAIK